MHIAALSSPTTKDALQERATAGDRAAQVALGMTLGDQGLRWLERAAEQGSTFAIGLLHSNFSSKAFLDKAVDARLNWERLATSWAAKGAQLGDPYLQDQLGVYLSEGRGISKSEATAVDWWKQAAENGSIFAQNSLATALLDGRGTDRDDVEALKWATLVARRIRGPGFGRIKELDLEALKGRMSSNDIMRAELLAQEWRLVYEQRESRKRDANERECGRSEFNKNVVF